LYFVIEGQVDAGIRTLVERDRKYARKFLVNEQELVSALTPPKFQVAEGVVDASIFSTWTERLAEANLEYVIFNNDSLPQRIKRIEADYGHKELKRPSAATIRQTTAPPFISNIVLNDYRACPVKRTFDFGSVTLITGPNGTGKTSLLEALELLYCGTNKRNPKSRARYALTATFRNGNSESAKNGLPSTSDLRNRNLAWYGQTDIRTNTLYQSFSKYNFLDTDAAVGLADSKADFEEDLSKLLVGPEASKTWREIERTNGELEKTLKELTSVEQQVRLELGSVERQLAAASSVPKESDALLTTLDKQLNSAGWVFPREDLSEQVPVLISVFAVYGPLVEEALVFDWVESPLTIKKLRQFSIKSRKDISDLDSESKAAEAIAAEIRTNELLIKDLNRKEKDIGELSIYLENGFEEKEKRLVRVRTLLQDSRRLWAVLSIKAPDIEKIPALTAPLSEFHENNLKEREQTEVAFDASRKLLEDFIQLRNQAQSLAQQLRDIASQVISTREDRDICPLCHAEYRAGELEERIYQDVDDHLEAESGALREAVRNREAAFEKASQSVSFSKRLLQVPIHVGMDTDTELRLVKEKLIELNNQNETLKSEYYNAESEFQSLQDMGLTRDRYEILVTSVFAGETVPYPSTSRLDNLLTQLAEERQIASLSAEKLTKDLSDKLAEISKILDKEHQTLRGYQRSIAQLQDRCDQVQSIVKRFDSSCEELTLPEDEPLFEIHTTIKLIRKILSEVQLSITNEEKANVIAAEASERKEEIKQQLAGLEPRIKRLREANDVFNDILEKLSLAGAMEAALEKNKAAIEEIFRRIHSPAEFSRLSDMTTLVRKNGEIAKLQQISTGQRAAFALSLFLAQNAQLRTAPPIMLIDDPIAHVDDLNCLSFLDYLREVALSGERQIVFATANEKIASLFERKFDFLGETEFRRHRLSR